MPIFFADSQSFAGDIRTVGLGRYQARKCLPKAAAEAGLFAGVIFEFGGCTRGPPAAAATPLPRAVNLIWYCLTLNIGSLIVRGSEPAQASDIFGDGLGDGRRALSTFG